ncbi:right-handed parallel beta-helix repeat-containing protein [bacterium]|nr:right-handed parallel beta-helix repeat-containing protein [bacterium]
MGIRRALLALAPLLLAAQSLAVTIDVPAAKPTIAAGIAAASYGDTVVVGCGTYYEHGMILKSGVTLRSATGEADCVTVDAQQQGWIFRCGDADSTTSIAGFTITGGNHHHAGAISVVDSPIRITDCRFTKNYASIGGGALLFESIQTPRPRVERCSFEHNQAGTSGGAVYCTLGSPEFIDCSFLHNESVWGGAVSLSGHSRARFSRCVIAGNIAQWVGGGIQCSNNSDASLENCTLSGNRADPNGGCIWCYRSSPTMTNCLIAFNHGGGAVRIDYSGEPSLSWCNIYGNTDGDWTEDIVDQLGVDGNFSEDPCFCWMAGEDYTLCENSPCLPANGVVPALVGAYDQGCGYCESPVKATSWGVIKSLYR